MTLEQFLTRENKTTAAFAAEVGVPASTITRIIRRERTPRIETIRKIVDATGGIVTINSFFDREAAA
ncbi:helix-turn-helix transcriptional regulator [Fulvimarina sp. 2208YS6-2-32]|uniref:helix-turn-helix transcriptional regulator n=1 Tax=Fulvimarina uroteuthidis TaxID=3098149 RepID=UPI003A100AD4